MDLENHALASGYQIYRSGVTRGEISWDSGVSCLSWWALCPPAGAGRQGVGGHRAKTVLGRPCSTFISHDCFASWVEIIQLSLVAVFFSQLGSLGRSFTNPIVSLTFMSMSYNMGTRFSFGLPFKPQGDQTRQEPFSYPNSSDLPTKNKSVFTKDNG